MVNDAIILGLYGSNSLGVVRSLGLEDIPLIGVHMTGRKPHSINSRYLDQSMVFQGEEEIVEGLIKIGENQNDKGVIHPTSDKYLLICCENNKQLEKYFHIPDVPGRSLRKLMSKEINSTLANGSGFRLPWIGNLSSYDGSEFPVILKPLNSVEWSKEDMAVYDDGDKLLEAKDQLLNIYGEMLVQEFIPGGSDSMYVVNTINNSDGPVIAGMQRNVLSIQKDPNVYIGVVFESVFEDSIVDSALKLTSNLNYNGSLDIDLKKSKLNGEYYFIEVNFRTGANNWLNTIAGLNVPAIMHFDLTGQDYGYLLNKPFRRGIKWLHEERIPKYLENGSESQLIEELNGLEARVLFYDGDPEPFNSFKRESGEHPFIKKYL